MKTLREDFKKIREETVEEMEKRSWKVGNGDIRVRPKFKPKDDEAAVANQDLAGSNSASEQSQLRFLPGLFLAQPAMTNGSEQAGNGNV